MISQAFRFEGYKRGEYYYKYTKFLSHNHSISVKNKDFVYINKTKKQQVYILLYYWNRGSRSESV